MAPPAPQPESRIGVIVRAREGLLFLGGAQAVGFVEAARVNPVPGAAFGVLWFEGQVVVALPFEAFRGLGAAPTPEAGTRRPAALICEIAGRRYGLTGLGLVASGRFPAGSGPELVRYGEQEVLGVALEPPALFGGAG